MPEQEQDETPSSICKCVSLLLQGLDLDEQLKFRDPKKPVPKELIEEVSELNEDSIAACHMSAGANRGKLMRIAEMEKYLRARDMVKANEMAQDALDEINADIRTALQMVCEPFRIDMDAVRK